MGREQRRLEVVATVSRHNSPADRTDDAMWEELRDAIEHIVNRERYRIIYAEVL